jgi:hypothetical protein
MIFGVQRVQEVVALQRGDTRGRPILVAFPARILRTGALATTIGGAFKNNIISATNQGIAFDAVITGLPCIMHSIACRDNSANWRRHCGRRSHERQKRERTQRSKGCPHFNSPNAD